MLLQDFCRLEKFSNRIISFDEYLEIFPSHLEDRAWRLCLFGDKLEQIEEFDPLTGDKVRELSLVKVYANSHYITPKPTIEQAVINRKKELEMTCLKNNTDVKHTTNSNNDFGINKGGLVTNTRKLGETEVIEIVDNIYYEGVDNNDCDR